MEISRSCDDWLAPECFVSAADTTVILNSNRLRMTHPATSMLRTPEALPLRSDSGSHHYLNYFCEQKPVKPPAESLRKRMRQNCEPSQTSGKKYDFAEKSADYGANKILSPMFHDVSRDPRNQRIGQEKSRGCPVEQLRQSSSASGIEHG